MRFFILCTNIREARHTQALAPACRRSLGPVPFPMSPLWVLTLPRLYPASHLAPCDLGLNQRVALYIDTPLEVSVHLLFTFFLYLFFISIIVS